MERMLVTPEPFSLNGRPPPQALLLWEWGYNGSDVVADGTLVSTRSPNAEGYYQILGVTGSRNGAPIVGLEPNGNAIPGNEGYPVDNLISAKGSLTVNGFGYKTVDKSYANPYYANYLTPPIYQEVFTQPHSTAFLKWR
ncbi:MAG: hypothetical protein ACJ8AI_33940 [Rhodopila sp.]